ncbi:MAG: BrnA antitoxin family protein [Thiomicrospira sp.]
MRTLEQRAELDDFELADNYDFSQGVRGRFYQPKKVATTIRLDNDILLYLKKKASEEHIGYQTLINSLLRDYIKHEIKPNCP